MSVGVISGSLAGCSTPPGAIELGEPTTSQDSPSVRFGYDHDDETLIRVYFNRRPDTPWKSVNRLPDSPAFDRLQVGIEQPGDVTLDTYRFRFKPAGEAAANIYLHPPEAGHEDTFDTYRDGDWTIIEAEYDGGTPVGTGFEILVHSDTESVDGPASILADYKLNASGDGSLDGTFVAQDRTTVALRRAE